MSNNATLNRKFSTHSAKYDFIEALKNGGMNSAEPVTIDYADQVARNDYDVKLDTEDLAGYVSRVNAYVLGEYIANVYETDYVQDIHWTREDNGMDREDNSRDAELIANQRSTAIAGYMQAFANLAPQA